jgi:hypothetical protein
MAFIFPPLLVSLPRRRRGSLCACNGATSERCKSSSRQTLSGLVPNGNCVAARRGGEQPEGSVQSVGERTRYGQAYSMSLQRPRRNLAPPEGGGPVRLRGSVRKPRRGTSGGWRRNGHDGVAQDAGSPARGHRRCSCARCRRAARAGVRAPIVARKRRNGRGAKGRRERNA